MVVEILSDNELMEITGYRPRAWQRRWLGQHCCHYTESRNGRPLVGRQYASMKLNGEAFSVPPPGRLSPLNTPTWASDISKVK
ncbi:DUF4224 domain-containing protein [Pseudomonas sichuanensis]|uniref:DUF4224 domain-containing protein n=1 Tax=Pseudomonas sichuanensis TaxID=2213015 RepID=UPI0035A5C9AA